MNKLLEMKAMLCQLYRKEYLLKIANLLENTSRIFVWFKLQETQMKFKIT